MGSSQPWIDAAYSLITEARAAEEPLRLNSAVESIRRAHPDCGLTEPELVEIVRRLVIYERWSLDSS